MRKIFFLLFLFFLSAKAQAFLNDRDPKDFFQILRAAPEILWVKAEKVQPLTSPSGYLTSLSIQKNFRDQKSKSILLFEEKIFPNEPSSFQVGGEYLVFLDGLPDYSLYQSIRSQGAAYRIFGPKSWIIPLTSQNRGSLEKIIQNSLAKPTAAAQISDLNLLFMALASPVEAISKDAARQILEYSRRMTRPDLSKEQETIIVQAISRSSQDSAQLIQLITALKNFKLKEVLQLVAKNSQGQTHWLALSALQDLGVFENIELLQRQFWAAGEDEKLQILPLIITRPSESPAFLKKLFESKDILKIQLRSIDLMVEQGKSYEALILTLLDHSDDNIKAASMVASAKIGSEKAVPILIERLHDHSPLIQKAAQLALEVSEDPRASEALRARERMGEGHVH